MNEPKIDPRWADNRSDFPLQKFLVAGIPILIIIIAIVISFFKSYTPLGGEGAKDVYSPGQQKIGFVKKSNDLLSILLLDTVGSVKPVDLASLNAHYRALDFDLPYASDNVACINGADLRLVGIHSDRIPEEFREFYFNSRLPQLLDKQSENLAETYFKIALASKSTGMMKKMSVKSIELLSSMFKIALKKDPWKGTIYSTGNCLFNEQNSVFLTYGNTVLPLCRNDRNCLHNSYELILDGNKIKPSRNEEELDYYQYYLDTYNKKKSVRFALENNRDVNLCCVGDTMVISSEFDFNYGKRKLTAGDNVKIEVSDGRKLIFYSNDKHKLAEFTINTVDPTRVLSSMTHTSTGTSRYVISRNQTDLFTQQIIRGLCRNLSASDKVNDVHITIDPLLSREFEQELKDYLNSQITKAKNDTKNFPRNQKDPEFDISLTIMDLATGNVIASPFYSSQFDKERRSDAMQITTRNVALSRRSIGSAFKPLLALAAVQTNPDLLKLETRTMYSDVNLDMDNPNATAVFHGRRTKSWAKGTSHWNGTDFVNFIAHSDDVYPVSLAALALSQTTSDYHRLPIGGRDDIFQIDPSTNNLAFIPGKFHKDMAFSHWLSLISYGNHDEDTPITEHLFEGIYDNEKDVDDKEFGLSEVCPDATNLHYDYLSDDALTDFRDKLVPWVLGQGGNEWSCMSIGESWCRMLGKRDVHTRLVQNNNDTPLIVGPNEDNYYCVRNDRNFDGVNRTWNDFLDKLAEAQKVTNGGSLTLLPMYNAVTRLNNDVQCNLVLFSKTGTPDSYVRDEYPILNARKRYLDVGVYAFALIDQNEFSKIKANDSGKGIVCVIRLTRSYRCNGCHGETKCNACKKASGFWGTTAEGFFSNGDKGRKRLNKFYTMTKSYY